MTKQQARQIALVLRSHYPELDGNRETINQRISLRRIMIDMANVLRLHSTQFDRDAFLHLCGHPEWEHGRFHEVPPGLLDEESTSHP